MEDFFLSMEDFFLTMEDFFLSMEDFFLSMEDFQSTKLFPPLSAWREKRAKATCGTAYRAPTLHALLADSSGRT